MLSKRSKKNKKTGGEKQEGRKKTRERSGFEQDVKANIEDGLKSQLRVQFRR